MAAPPRTAETVTREIEVERDRLAAAVSNLRGDLKAAANPRALLRATWPGLAVLGMLVGGAVAFGIVRGQREQEIVREVVRARFGRFTVLERI
jgi:hypothetical protein